MDLIKGVTVQRCNDDTFFTLFPLTPFSQGRSGDEYVSNLLIYNEISPLPRERDWGEGNFI